MRTSGYVVAEEDDGSRQHNTSNSPDKTPRAKGCNHKTEHGQQRPHNQRFGDRCHSVVQLEPRIINIADRFDGVCHTDHENHRCQFPAISQDLRYSWELTAVVLMVGVAYAVETISDVY